MKTIVAASPLGAAALCIGLWPGFHGLPHMDISRAEQRILHLLAQGGWIEFEKTDEGDIGDIFCRTRDGWLFSDIDLTLFRKLKRKKALASKGGGPYRITRRGLQLVRAQLDNR